MPMARVAAHEYDFTIEYQPGKENVVADALSRKSILTTLTLLRTSIIDVVRQASLEDPFFKKIASALVAHREAAPLSRWLPAHR